MTTKFRFLNTSGLLFFTALALAVICANAYIGYRLERSHARKACEAQIAGWFAGPKLMTYVMMERYGPPDSLTPQAASWFDRGPWKRIVVHSDRPDTYLEQAVGYQTDPEASRRLKTFGSGVIVDAVNDELAARSDSEPLNILALNLADEVARNRMSVDQAHKAFLRTADLTASGKSSALSENLMFQAYSPPLPDMWGQSKAY